MQLNIEVTENGFIVYEGQLDRAIHGKKWVFESAVSLGEFTSKWGGVVEDSREIIEHEGQRNE